MLKTLVDMVLIWIHTNNHIFYVFKNYCTFL